MAPSTPQEKCPVEVWEQIFSYMGDATTASLTACRETCSDFEYWVDERTTLWDRISLRRAVEENNVEIVRKIVEKSQYKNPADDRGFTPMHRAAELGHLEIFRLIMENVQDKNPYTNWISWIHYTMPQAQDIWRSVV